jgi:hypothetical protein
MLYMVIEHFRNRDGAAIYRRARERGRMMPEGLSYVGSWVELNLDRCFQVMACEDPKLLEVWAANWADLVAFEFVQVVTGAEMAEKMKAEG